MENNKKRNIFFIIGVLCLLILVIGASFAYYHLHYYNNTNSTTIGGGTGSIGQPYLVTNVASLNLNLTKEMMNNSNIGKKYYATESGTPVTSSSLNNGNYKYATVSLIGSSIPVDCSYSYNISLTTSKNVDNIPGLKVAIIEENGTRVEYSYEDLQYFSGINHESIFRGITQDSEKSNYIEMYIENTNEDQSALIDNELNLEISPGPFSCSVSKTFAEELIASGELWSSGLEGDGLRYVGSGSYNSATTPSNFVCFGTTSQAECKANEEKYMYRIIGVFPDEQGNQHLKLRKFKQLGEYAWHSTKEDKNWGESTLYTELNGSYFLENTTYDYLQDATWTDKIVEWKWTAVNTKTYDGSNGPNYYNGSTMTPANIYLHEMNRSTKTSEVGEWTYPEGKIGLMYASDYVLSLGDEALAITGSTSSNYEKLKTGWLNPINNDTSKSSYEWILARYGANGSYFYAWYVGSTGIVYYLNVALTNGVAPAFYLTSNTIISGGMGTYSEPYIIG